MAKTKVKLISINKTLLNYPESYLDHYFNYTLFLRNIRKVGDEEVVNNFVLGQLNRAKENGLIDFEKI